MSPKATGEAGLGRDTLRWGEIHGVTIKQNGKRVLDESSGIQTSSAFSITLAQGVSSGSVDISSLALSAAPSYVFIFPPTKHAYGDANLYATVVKGGVTSTAIPFELNAPTDNANRIVQILVIP